MYNDEVCDIVCPAGIYQLAHDIVATVQPLCIRKDQSKLLKGGREGGREKRKEGREGRRNGNEDER